MKEILDPKAFMRNYFFFTILLSLGAFLADIEFKLYLILLLTLLVPFFATVVASIIANACMAVIRKLEEVKT